MRTSSLSFTSPQLSSFDVTSTVTSSSTSTSSSSSSSTTDSKANDNNNNNNGEYTYSSYQLLMNMYQKYQMVQQQTMMNQSHNKISTLTSTSSTGGTTPKSPSPITPLSVVTPSSNSDLVQVVHNLVILDWDDTCYPTTHFVSRQQRPTAINLGLFGKYLYLFLNALIAQYGESNICIITNAAKDWVFRSLRESSKKYQQQTAHDLQMKGQDYFAAIYNSLLTENIRIISAQDMFCKKYPNQPLLWKINAFKQITKQHFTVQTNPSSNSTQYLYCILSIGDSEDEFTAALEAKQVLNKQIKAIPLSQYNNNIDCKSEVLLHRVKLADDPCIVQMMHQLNYLTNNLDVFVSTDTPITVRL